MTAGESLYCDACIRPEIHPHRFSPLIVSLLRLPGSFKAKHVKIKSDINGVVFFINDIESNGSSKNDLVERAPFTQFHLSLHQQDLFAPWYNGDEWNSICYAQIIVIVLFSSFNAQPGTWWVGFASAQEV